MVLYLQGGASLLNRKQGCIVIYRQTVIRGKRGKNISWSLTVVTPDTACYLYVGCSSCWGVRVRIIMLKAYSVLPLYEASSEKELH